MTEKEWFVIIGSIFLLVAFFPFLPIVFWFALWLAAWYIRKIPERHLPFAAFFATHQPTFYNWLSGFFTAWLQLPRLAFFLIVVPLALLWLALSFGLFPGSWNSSSILVADSSGVKSAFYKTTGKDEPHCFGSLLPGTYVVTETNPRGFVSSTIDTITTTIPADGLTLVGFGNFQASSNLSTTPALTNSRTLTSTRSSSSLAPGMLCVMSWNDLNANGFREFSEPLLPELSLSEWVNPVTIVLLDFLFLILNVSGFTSAKGRSWDALLWQAEPTAKLLVGGDTEYAKLTAVDQRKLIRHVAEASVGINKGTWVVSAGKAKLVNAPSETFAKFGGPGVLIVQEGHAVVLEQKGVISGVKGVGLHFLKPFERVSLVIYLAPQHENFEIHHVVTKDKVIIEKMELYIFHRMDPGAKLKKNGMYPFDIRVILEKIWTPKGPENEDKSADLGASVRSVANGAVRDVVAKYDLVDVITATGEMRDTIKGELLMAMGQVTDNAMGIKIIAVDIGAIIIPPDAQTKLLERWKTDWEAEITRIKATADVAKAEAAYHSRIANAEASKIAKMVEGEGEAYALRAKEVARAEAAAEKIRQVGAVKAQSYLDSESFLGLIKYVFNEDSARASAEGQAQKKESSGATSAANPKEKNNDDNSSGQSESKEN